MLKIFISYSHRDETHIEEFRKHLQPLKDCGLVEEWYDRRILAGEDYEKEINNNLEDADIICLFISANFLSSESCKKEKKKALELRKKKDVAVIPIILEQCGWQDDDDIKKLLALPTDGKPISSFSNRNEGWYDVYKELKKVIQERKRIKELRLTEKFEDFLQSVEVFEYAHSQKEKVLLDDIFVYPELFKYDNLRERKNKINSRDIINDILNYERIAIAGEDQSGKTTLCKIIFKKLREMNFVPIYISGKRNQLKGNIDDMMSETFREQYIGLEINEIDNRRIVPIIDDFHYVKKKEEKLEKLLNKYPMCIITIDDIFGLNIRDKRIIESFYYFEIKQFSQSLIYELVRKWVELKGKEVGTSNDMYKEIDRRIEGISSFLGRNIGKGILPAYPFFIISAMMVYETFTIPLDQEITSLGYCYQALIYFYLRKQGVKNDEIDIYINFLTELAFYFYRERKIELSYYDFDLFMKYYLNNYNLPINQEKLLENLSLIVSRDSLNNYSFRYIYIYYYFVAKYLVENINDSSFKEEIKRIMSNLHVDENAYIAIFMAHHSRNVSILDELEINAKSLFDKYMPATLTKDEVKFFDEQVSKIIEATLPPADTTPEIERTKLLKYEDELEEAESTEREDYEEDNSIVKELRRAIRTAEVMGCIIKNRAGSLPKKDLERIFTEAMNIHLRILSSFLDMIKYENTQKDLIEFLSKLLNKIISEKKISTSQNELRRIATFLFWNLCYFVVYGIIRKTIHTLGSEKLISIVDKVCAKKTPATILIRHGILMWYNKNLQIRELAESFKDKKFSKIAEEIARHMVSEYCYLHRVDYKDRERIKTLLKISVKPSSQSH